MIKKFLQSVMVAFALSVAIVAPLNFAHAQATVDKDNCSEPAGVFKDVSKDCACKGTCTLCDILTVGITITNMILSVMAILAVLFFVYGAGYMVLSQGNSGMVEKGKGILRATIMGTVVVLVAWQLMANVVVLVVNRTILETPELNQITGWFNVANTCKVQSGQN